MPIATPEVYNEMLDRAKAGKFAYPAINVTSTQTLHAALRGFAEAESDGIIQISTGGAEFLGGQYNKDMVTGSVALAEFAHIVAKKYDITVALHTDHCPKDKLDGYVRPLLAISEERVKAGRNPLFQSHMWDGSAETLADNLSVAQELLARTAGRDLDDAVALRLREAAQGGVQGLRGGDVDGRVGELACLRPVEHLVVDLGGCDGHLSAPWYVRVGDLACTALT